VEQVLPRLRESANGTPHSGATMNGSAALLTPRDADATPLATIDALNAELMAKLGEWHAAAGASQDCPLPELYRRLATDKPASIRQFHDALRQLHDDGQVYLHPWTGPLYALPEPAFALLVGHEIAYYASVR